jgi:co-chaperonin GroES (HSP10)
MYPEKFLPKKNYVLIHFVKKEGEKKSKGGIYLPFQENGGQSQKEANPDNFDFVVEAIGSEVKDVKVGDYVVFNEYDMKGLQDKNDEIFALTKEESIMATYE